MLEDARTTASPDEFAVAIRQLAKEQWYQTEVERRGRLKIPMTEPLDSWQVWNADPIDVAALIEGVETVLLDFAHTKLNPSESEITRFITFRPSLIVSNASSHSRGRALVCPISGKQRQRNGDVHLEKASWRSEGTVLTAFLRSIDSDIELPLERRELLCIQRQLENNYWQAVRKEIDRVFDNRWPLAGAFSPGAVVQINRVSGDYGVVIATCRLFSPNSERNVALLAMNFDAAGRDILDQLSDQQAQEIDQLGLIRIAWNDDEGDRNHVEYFDLLGLQCARIGDLTSVGHAVDTTAVAHAQQIFRRFLAEAV